MKIDAQTSLYLLIGNPVGHSLSPVMYNAAFKRLHLNAVYLASAVKDGELPAAIQGMRSLAIRGANVTSPHKEAVIPFLNEVSRESALIRSVNTIISRPESGLHGTSTDGEGFYLALQAQDSGILNSQKVTVIGSGGAARALTFTLAQKGVAAVNLFNRTVEKADIYAEILLEHTPVNQVATFPLTVEKLTAALASSELIIYTLPFDLPELLTAIALLPGLDANQKLFDLRYNPPCTAIMDSYQKKGGQSYNGLKMLLWQAVLSFELFSGLKAPISVMQEALNL